MKRRALQSARDERTRMNKMNYDASEIYKQLAKKSR